MNVEIAPLVATDIEALCVLARRIWRHHYPPIIGRAQTEYMLAQRYDPELIRSELASGKAWWDTLKEEGALVAFSSSFVLPDAYGLKIDKLYVDPSRQRVGYGGALLAHARHRAARLKLPKLVLAVNKRNASAIGAYRKHGFRIAEAVVTDIGGGFVMDDFIMELEVRADGETGGHADAASVRQPL